MKKQSLMISLAFLAAATLLLSPAAQAQLDDYDPVTGEPNCVKCHTPDKKYSIDYSREDTCVECHGPGLSDRYLDINDRYRVHEAKNEKTEVASDMVVTASTKEPARPGAAAKAPREMVLVPSGEFTMGSNEWWPKSQPEYKASVKAFYIDRYEVTNERYKEFVDATGRPAPRHWIGGRIPPGKRDHPVVYVTWYDADAFCRWEGKRLPTEVEWEKAARGTDGRTFPWGDKFDKDKGNTPQYGNGDTMPVGSFENGKSPYGAYDMAGNAFEWVDNWFQPYPGNTHPDENYGKKYKVLKGGSWYDCTYYKCGISAPAFNRIFFHPRTRNNNFGFRCAKDK
ncbi:MAG: formylglycine-generating enzyme family protein [Thermodesulfobacteriota bacterium]